MAKTVFITGCSDGGIGSALAKRFAERGFNVIASARSMSKMTALETLSNVTLLELDVCSTKSVAAALQAVSVHTGGKLDYLVNNAGVGYRSAALEVDEQMAKALFDVNFWSAVNMCRTFAPLVIEGKGTIVNVSSLSGIGVPILWGSMYNASKAALDTYSNTLRLELLPFGVRVVSLVPAAVETNMTISGSFPSTLPGEGSIFKPAERHIARSRLPELMALDKFAEKVVVDLLAGATGRIWRGAFASRVWAIMTFCPGFVLDWLVSQDQGLDLLRRDKHA